MNDGRLHLPHEELLRWYIDAGADECIGEEPTDRYAQPRPEARPHAETPNRPAPSPPSAPRPSAPSADAPLQSRDGLVRSASMQAASAKSLEELRAALEGFEGCGLKRTATHLVFADGNPKAKVMLVGEAPGAEEDRRGLPFVGQSGQLLDRMLAAIGLDRSSVYITNILPWRPPGNREPATDEIALCLPFVERHIELVDPETLICVGGTAAKALLATREGVQRLRGRWFDYSSPGLPRPVAATVLFHPAYLLRSPGQKREAWRDLLSIRERLDERAAARR